MLHSGFMNEFLMLNWYGGERVNENEFKNEDMVDLVVGQFYRP